MHVHFPKPLHGWREFAGEVGIIVVGVLIALGAEQVVDSIRDRQQVLHSEQSLRDNFIRFVKFAAELDAYKPCVIARAAELRHLLDHSAVSHALPSIGPIPQLPPHPWQIDSYNAMVASQAITHVPTDRAILYSRIAMSAIDLHEASIAAWADWGALAGLSGGKRSFSEAEEAQNRMLLARAVHNDGLMRIIADRTVDRIGSTDLLSQRAFDSAVASGRNDAEHMEMCKPIYSRQ